jgi:O-antigen/teichoic acid export membrane protein
VTAKGLAPDNTQGPQGRHRAATSSIGRVLFASGMARLVVLPLTGICSLVISRLITDAVGIELFGEVMLIATLSQLLMFADLGAGAAVATARARLAENPADADLFRRTVLTGLRTMLVSAGLIAFAAVGIGLLGAWPVLLGIDRADPGSAWPANLATVGTLLAFAVSLPFALGEAVLRGGGRLHHAVLFGGLTAPTALLLTVLLQWQDAAPFAYALTLPLGTLLTWLCLAVAGARSVRSTLTGLPRQLLRPRRFPGQAIAATAAPWFAVMIGLPLALQSDRIVIAHRVDPASLSDYSYAAQLYLPLWSVVSLAALALWPVFAAHRKPGESMRRSWLTGVAILGGAGCAFSVAFLLLAGVVIDWSSRGAASPEPLLLLSFAALLVVQSLHACTGILLISPTQLRFQALCVLALLVTNLPLSWVLAPELGAAGPVLASAVTVAACQLVPGLVAARRATSTAAAPGPLTRPQPEVAA